LRSSSRCPASARPWARCSTAAPGSAATFTAQCSNDACAALRVVPHSCGHRHCPHCQHADSQRWIERQRSQRWIERQRSQLVTGPYFLITFTLAGRAARAGAGPTSASSTPR